VSERVVVMSITLSWLVPAVLRGGVFTPLYYVHKRKTLMFFLSILLVIFEALPCLLIFVAAVRISIIARRQKLQHRNKSKERSNTKVKNKRSSTGLKMILFVAFFFIVCYSLEVYYSMCKNVLKLCKDTEIFQIIRRLFLIANSAVNPFAYAYLKRDIKEEVKRKANAFCRKRNLELNAQPDTEPEVQSVNLD